MTDSNNVQFSVERNSFVHQLNEYRKNEEYTDVKLKVGDKLFPAHRVALAPHSPVLKALISDQWSTTNICQLSDEYVDVEIMEDLLSFLYTGKIELTPDNVHPVCMAAHFLQIPELLKASVEHLRRFINVENVLTLFKFSTACEIESLKYFCLRFVNNNYERVFERSEILDFLFEDFKDLIVGLKKFWTKMLRENTFQCIVRWVEKNLSNRSNDFPILLKNIPLEELPLKFLTETVPTYSLVKDSIICIETISEALANYQTYQNMIVIGGEKAGSDYTPPCISYYDSRTGVWEDLSDLPSHRSDFGVTVVNQQDIVVCGGHFYKERNYYTSSVEMFEWSTKSWIELPRMPIACTHLSMAACDGNLYVIGRFNSVNGSYLLNSKYSSSVLCYSFKTEQWTYVASMNSRRLGGRLIAYRNQLYAVGGETSTLEKYDSTQDKWTLLANIPNLVISRATFHQGKIYFCGYKKSSYNPDRVFNVYDPETNVWNSLPAPPYEKGTSLVSMNGKLLLSGGYPDNKSDHKKSDLIWEFDFTENEWFKFGELNTGMVYHSTLAGHFY